VQFLTHAKLEVPNRLKASFAKVRAAVEQGDFRSPDLKKLSRSYYFRLKLDYDARLLVSFVEHAGKRACLALELIEQHAYERSRFLRGARVEEQALSGDGQAEVQAATQQLRYLHPERRQFHFLDKPLSFDDRQAELYKLPLPVILVGCAGSGKTALTLTKLREIPGEVLYVTQSPYLVENAATLYHSHGYQNEAQSVSFLSYRALLESIQLPAGRSVTLQDFRGFFSRYGQGIKFTSAHQLFEEFRGVLGADPSGPLGLEQYLALGVRKSIYDAAQRALVHASFLKYPSWLSESALYDTNLLAQQLAPRAEAQYDAAVVDEVQDLTNAELSLVLSMLKTRDAFLLCGDANQIVHPNFFAWSAVKSLFYSSEQAAVSAKIHVLEANYRSSRSVCEVANTLLKVKNARFGSIDRESTVLVRPAAEAAGKLIGLVKKDGVLRELNQRTKSSTNVAVIVLSAEQKAEARQKFATPLVFSIHEAKGLEYEAVILYDLVSSERQRFREVADGVTPEMLVADELVYSRAKDKGDKSLEVYKFFVNALYVALTRAVDTVYVVESDTAHPLLGLLGVRCGEDLSQISQRTSSLDEWQKEARRLELQGKNEQAEAIRRNVLRLTPVPWPVIDVAGLRESHARAFATGSAYAKAKQRLCEFAAYHRLGTLAYDLKFRAGYAAPKPLDALAKAVRERAMAHYLAGDQSKVLSEVARYGADHRSLPGLTPLMMAAELGNLDLCEKLVDRGASLDAVDTLGRMPIHFALRRAFHDADFARSKLGPLYDALCPLAIDIEESNRRLRIGKNQGEFWVLLVLVARMHELYSSTQRLGGFTASVLDEGMMNHFPPTVLPEERRRRSYWNGVLARAEIDSAYRPARRLWRRERTGHYLPSNVAVRVAGEAGKPERYVPLPELLCLDLLDPHTFPKRSERSVESGAKSA
jgi:hypothetical protein